MSTKRVVVCIIAALMLWSVPTAGRADSDTGGVRGFVRVRHFRNWQITPVADAAVTVSGLAGEWQTKTSDNGFFVIFGIPPGRYLISAQPEEFYYLTPPVASSHHICVHAAEQRDVSLLLLDPQTAIVDFWGDHSWFYYLAQIALATSQTADMYSVGEC